MQKSAALTAASSVAVEDVLWLSFSLMNHPADGIHTPIAEEAEVTDPSVCTSMWSG